MKTIKLQIEDNMDIALLLTGINYIRMNNINHTRLFLSLPKEFKKDKVLMELVSDYDRLNSLGAQLSKMLMEREDVK